MARLILVPQLPVRMRYQEWWFTQLPLHYKQWFDDVLVLGGDCLAVDPSDSSTFSHADRALRYEALQIEQYTSLNLRHDDVLLLCDLSYPGTFAHVLWHKRPFRAFAICHASARNRHDIFAPVRKGKFAVERATALLFDAVFVGSRYHAQKLKWPNVETTPLPYPPQSMVPEPMVKTRPLVTVARHGIQKRTVSLERTACKISGVEDIWLPKGIATWEQYYRALAQCSMLLSTAKEETFGYQIVDAVISGVVPIAPNDFSYPELLPRDYLYSNEEELKRILLSKLLVPQLLVHNEMLKFYETTALRMLMR